MAGAKGEDQLDLDLRAILGYIPRGRLIGGQGRGLCPSHDDHVPSLGIRRGTRNTHIIIWGCKGEPPCDPYDVRRDLIGKYGIPAALLGPYCADDRKRYDTRAAPRPEDLGWMRSEYDRVRAEQATDRAKLAAIDDLLGAKITPAMRSIRTKAVLEGIEVPRSKDEFLALAVRARVGRNPRYEAWAEFYVSAGLGSGVRTKVKRGNRR